MTAIIRTGLKVGLITGATVLLLASTQLLAIYHYIKLDYYVTAIALAALTTGVVLARRKPKQPETPPTPDPLAVLTAKELQILQLIAGGKTNKEIAAINFVEVSTIKTHINNLYGKLAVNNRKEAAAFYQNHCINTKSTLFPPLEI